MAKAFLNEKKAPLFKLDQEDFFTIASSWKSGDLQAFDGGQWIDAKFGHLASTGIYREKTRKPMFDFYTVDDKWNYLAVDGDREVRLYRKKPRILNINVDDCWTATGQFLDVTSLVGVLKGFTIGNCDWKDSLISRDNKEWA